jgi:hypothetical protein
MDTGSTQDHTRMVAGLPLLNFECFPSQSAVFTMWTGVRFPKIYCAALTKSELGDASGTWAGLRFQKLDQTAHPKQARVHSRMLVGLI